MSASEAAKLYIDRWLNGAIPQDEYTHCCELFTARGMTSHQKGFMHIAFLTHTPFTELRHAVSDQLTARSAFHYVEAAARK